MENNEQKKKQVRITLPEPISDWVNAAHLELSGRGADVTTEEILAPLFQKVKHEYFKKRIEELTPDYHLLELAKSHPEVLKVLSQHAKKLLAAAKRGEPVRIRRKRETQEAGREAN